MRLMFALGVVLGVMTSASSAQDADVGREHYHRHCATCHGMEGRGDGPMSGAMIIKPADLTTLAARNNGVFPTERVAKRIDGREPLVSHGSPMPVYGDFFEQVFDVKMDVPLGEPIWTSRPVIDLIAYLRELQAAP